MTRRLLLPLAMTALASLLFTGCASLQSGLSPTGGTPIVCDDACDGYAGCDQPGCPDPGCIAGWDGMAGGGCDTCYFGRNGNIQIVRGRAYALLDGIGDVFGVANKLALWDRRADNHRVSPSTEMAVATYLREHQLNRTLIRVNQYDPIDEWKRLMANDSISPGWKYTFGAYDWLKYTLIPGRLVGGDWYNPFSDSIHLYSDIPSIGLAKAAYAKDVYSRDYPGTYAAGQDVPIFGMWHETLANQDVLRYLKRRGNSASVAEAERILYPDYGGAWGAQVLGFLPYGNVYGRAAGAMAGHAVRNVKEIATGTSQSTLR